MAHTYKFPEHIEAAWKAVQLADSHMVKFAEAAEAVEMLAEKLGCDASALVHPALWSAMQFAALENEAENARWAARAEAEAQAAEAGMAYLGAS